jgi:hypothetical protein
MVKSPIIQFVHLFWEKHQENLKTSKLSRDVMKWKIATLTIKLSIKYIVSTANETCYKTLTFLLSKPYLS